MEATRLCTIIGGGLEVPAVVREIRAVRDEHGKVIALSGTACLGGRRTPVQTWTGVERWRLNEGGSDWPACERHYTKLDMPRPHVWHCFSCEQELLAARQ